MTSFTAWIKDPSDMSNHKNYRRGEEYRSEHGPRYENGDPGAGCNSTHVARARRKWHTHIKRAARRALHAFVDEMLREEVNVDRDQG